MYSFYEIFPDRGDLGGLFFCVRGGVLIFEIIEIFLGGCKRSDDFFCLKDKG